jgi:hypothetical protein
MAIENKHEKELNRMYDRLSALEPGSEEYDKVLAAIMKARDGETELKKIESERESAKTDNWIKIGTFVVGLIAAPLIDLGIKKSLAKYIGTIEQMETFTSTPGRSMSGWFRFK